MREWPGRWANRPQQLHEKVGRGANTAQQLSDSNHLQPQSQVSETKGSRRDEAVFQKLTQNSQQKILVSYIYSHNICISLITNKVCIYLLAIWIFSPMICWFESCAHFSFSVCVCTDLGALFFYIHALVWFCVKNTFFLLCDLLFLSLNDVL